MGWQARDAGAGCGRQQDVGRVRDVWDDQEEERSVSGAGSRYLVKSRSPEDWSTEGGWYMWYLP